MNLVLNQEAQPYEQTRHLINTLITTFNQFMIPNHTPILEEYNQSEREMKKVESNEVTKTLETHHRLVPHSPQIMQINPEGQQNLNMDNIKMKEIARTGLLVMKKHNKEIFGF